MGWLKDTVALAGCATQASTFRWGRRGSGGGVFGNFRFGNLCQQAGDNSLCIEAFRLGLKVGADSVPENRFGDFANVVECD